MGKMYVVIGFTLLSIGIMQVEVAFPVTPVYLATIQAIGVGIWKLIWWISLGWIFWRGYRCVVAGKEIRKDEIGKILKVLGVAVGSVAALGWIATIHDDRLYKEMYRENRKVAEFTRGKDRLVIVWHPRSELTEVVWFREGVVPRYTTLQGQTWIRRFQWVGSDRCWLEIVGSRKGYGELLLFRPSMLQYPAYRLWEYWF